MAEIRSSIPLIASETLGAREACVAFRNDEAGYAEWVETHSVTGHVLQRDSASAKVAHMHVALCPVVFGEEATVYAKSSKVGCPTKAAALLFAQKKKWEVKRTCDRCPTLGRTAP